MRLIKGDFIWIHEYNIFFEEVTNMLLEHYDNSNYHNCVIILGDYLLYSVAYFRYIYPGKKIVIYQLEQLVDGAEWNPNNIINNIKGADEIWDYDDGNIEVLNNAGINTIIKPILYCNSLRRIDSKMNCDIDILYYGTVNFRRFTIFQSIEREFYKLGCVRYNLLWSFGMNGKQLDSLIERSKIILNIHAFDQQRQEQVRMILPVINNKCVVSEISSKNYFGDAIVESTVENLPIVLVDLLKTGKWYDIGQSASEKFKNK